MSGVVTVGSMALKLTRKYSDFKSKKFVPAGLREKITGFSKEAKRNFLWRLQTLNFKMLAWCGYSAYFVTLTYQDGFYFSQRNLRLAKRDLDRFFRQELKRFLGDNWFSFWKLEFHKSGVPHFHLFLIVSNVFTYNEVQRAVNKAWVKSACFDAPVNIRDSMMKSSTQVRSTPLDLHQVLMVYVSKEVGKEFQVDVPGGELPGRFWGIYNRKLYKVFVREIHYVVSDEVFYRLRRDIKRWMRSKGYNLRLRSENGVRVFYISNIRMFERLLEYYGVRLNEEEFGYEIY